MIDMDKIHKQHIEMGIESGNLNDELLNNENIRIICCGSIPKNFENNSHEWFYYYRMIFKLEQKNLEKLYKTNVDTFYTELIDKNGKLYGDDNYDENTSFLYLIPSCIKSWCYKVGYTSFIYRSIDEIFKIAFEKPNERIIKEYMWSDDSNNIYRRFNRIMMEEHNKTINKNKEITDLLNKINDLIR